MATLKLTNPVVKQAKLKPGETQTELWDTVVPAFGLRIGKKRKTWVVALRRPGEKHCGRHRIGHYPHTSLADARQKARDMLESSTAGKDPFAKKPATVTVGGDATFGEMADWFLAEYPKSKDRRAGTMDKYRWCLKGSSSCGIKGRGKPAKSTPVVEWQDRLISDISRDDVISVFQWFNDQGKRVSANRFLSHMHKFFDWMLLRGKVQSNPAAGLGGLRNDETARERVLSDSELAEVWKAVDDLGTVFEGLFKLLILTGQRSGEVAGMREDELRDFDGPAPAWVLPGERTKNKKEHVVPLSPQAVKVIREALTLKADLIEFAGVPAHPYVFSVTGQPVKAMFHAVGQINRLIAKARGVGAAPMEKWTPHDLRRTLYTHMHDSDMALPHIIKAVVNHTGDDKSGVAAVYNKAAYLRQKREALEAWANYVDRLVGNNVVPMATTAATA